VDIKVEGLKWSSVDFVKSKLGLVKGSKVTPLNLREALRRLYRGDYFSDIEFQGEFSNDTLLILIVKVKENPRLGKYKFKGAKKINGKELADSLNLRKGEPISERKKFEWRTKILGLYVKKGYLRAEVDIIVKEPNERGFSDVVFNIKEGEKFKIGSIEIEGNENIPDSILKSKMKNKEEGIFGRGNFKEDEWYADLERIEDYYRNHGFPNAKVDSFHFDYKRGFVYIKIYVTEGKKYRFGNVYFEGNELFSEEFLKKRITLRNKTPWYIKLARLKKPIPWEEDLYSVEVLGRAIGEIGGLYADSGYIYVRVIPKETIRGDSIIDVTFKIDEGERIKVRKIEIVGNVKTKEWVIRRELDIFPGEYFSREKLAKSQRDLYFLNYFENVSIETEDTPDSGYVDIIFKVKEKFTGTMGLGISYSGPEGISYYIQYQQPNFIGRGQTITLYAQYGRRVRNYQLGFREPWLYGKPYSVGIDLHDLTRIIPQFDERRSGGEISFSFPFSNDYWRMRFSYSLEDMYISRVGSSYERIFSDWLSKPFLSSTLTWIILRDSRDRVFNAIRGSRISYQFELTGGPLRGDVHYHKHIFEAAKYIPIKEKWISLFRVKGGIGAGIYETSDIPGYALFWLDRMA
jgi:outer membrane protein insertion porin family